MIFGPAVSCIEFSSIARGYFILDQMIKKAQVKVLEAAPVSPGKFFILLNGDEASVDESRKTALELAGPHLIDEVYIPNLDVEVLPAVYAQNKFEIEESLGVVELNTISTGLLSADQARKAAEVHLIDFRLARGIGGKSYYFVTGSLESVQASVEAGRQVGIQSSTLLRDEIIANPHQDFLKYFNISGA